MLQSQAASERLQQEQAEWQLGAAVRTAAEAAAQAVAEREAALQRDMARLVRVLQ